MGLWGEMRGRMFVRCFLYYMIDDTPPIRALAIGVSGHATLRVVLVQDGVLEEGNVSFSES